MALTDADRLQMTAIALMKHNHVLSGAVYEPVVYNDEGVYSYFYIDFLKAVAPFSLGMWNESIIIHDGAQVPVSNVEQAYTDNPYIPRSTNIDMAAGTLTDTVIDSKGVISLEAL